MTDGQEFKVRGERGTFVFRGIDTDGSVRCFGGSLGHGSWRNFKAERITKVLRKKQTV
jgi:hypothetical protein